MFMQIFSGYNHKKVSNIKNILEHVRKDCNNKMKVRVK